MSRLLVVASLLLTLGACVRHPVRTMAETPASGRYVLNCGLIGSCNQQAVADQAQAHCGRVGKDAEESSEKPIPGGAVFTYRCVPR